MNRRSGRRPAILAGCVSLLVIGGLVGQGYTATKAEAATVTRSASPPLCQRIAVPAYLDANTASTAAEMERILQASDQLGPIVLNIANGPGDLPDPGYTAIIARLQRAGADVFGYVDTGYAQRAEADVFADAQRWSDWYHVVSTFFDQVPSNSRELAPYYAYVANTHDRGGRAAFNPGLVPSRAVVELADITVTFEGSWKLYQSYRSPTWARKLASDRFWHLVYATSADDFDQALSRARKHEVGYVFITDDRPPNPWDALPSYWQRELRAAREVSGCAATADAP